MTELKRCQITFSMSKEMLWKSFFFFKMLK